MGTFTRPRRAIRSLALGIAIAAGAGLATFGGAEAVAAAPAATPTVAAAASCPTVSWGSLTKSVSGMTTAPITGLRSGRHACYDRMVIDVGAGRGPLGYSIRYANAVYQEGSGKVVPLRGGAKLEVVVRAPAYNVHTGTPTFNPARWAEVNNVTGFATFRQVAFAGSFEGQSTFGVGVRARLPFRAFVLNGPGSGHRLVLDVAHHW